MDGKKIDGQRIVVDAERGRVEDDWFPRYLGGGLGGHRRVDRSRRTESSHTRRSEDDDRRSRRRSRESRKRSRDKSRDKERRRDHKSHSKHESRKKHRDEDKKDRKH